MTKGPVPANGKLCLKLSVWWSSRFQRKCDGLVGFALSPETYGQALHSALRIDSPTRYRKLVGGS